VVNIAVVKLSGSTPVTDVNEPIYSTSAADTGTLMRPSGNQYIYNLAVRSLSDSSAIYEIRITIQSTGQQVPPATFGVKP